MMFSENHFKILQEINLGFSSAKEVANKIGLPVALTSNLLDELRQSEFIKAARGFNQTSGHLEIVGACLTIKGEAAVESPDYFLNKPMSSQGNVSVYGDRISGDKVMGDKVAGNKVVTQNTFSGNMSGIIGSNFSDRAQASNNTFTQTNNPTPNELLQLITNLRQTASQFPPEIQDDLIIDIDNLETELQKPESDRNPTKLKKRLLALATAGTLLATPIPGMTDFINNTLDLSNKLGIELPFVP